MEWRGVGDLEEVRAEDWTLQWIRRETGVHPSHFEGDDLSEFEMESVAKMKADPRYQEWAVAHPEALVPDTFEPIVADTCLGNGIRSIYSPRFIPYDWPMFVKIASHLAESCRNRTAREWLVSVYPIALIDRAECREPFSGFVSVLHVAVDKAPWEAMPEHCRTWTDHQVAQAITTRDAVASRSFTMPMLSRERLGLESSDFYTFCWLSLSDREDWLVVHWLNAIPEIEPTLMDYLYRVSWREAVQMARRWCEERRNPAT